MLSAMKKKVKVSAIPHLAFKKIERNPYKGRYWSNVVGDEENDEGERNTTPYFLK